MFTGSGLLYLSVAMNDCLCCILHVQELTPGFASAPCFNDPITMSSPAFRNLMIRAGITWESSRSNLSPWTVEVNRQQVNGVEVILLPVGLSLDQQHLLSQPIRRICLLGITVPQVFFMERHRRELGIRTHCAQDYALSTPSRRAASISWMPMIALS